MSGALEPAVGAAAPDECQLPTGVVKAGVIGFPVNDAGRRLAGPETPTLLEWVHGGTEGPHCAGLRAGEDSIQPCETLATRRPLGLKPPGAQRWGLTKSFWLVLPTSES